MGITDGSVYCGRCGEDRTVCFLCEDEPPMLVGRGFSRLPSYEDEREIMLQTRSIRAAAAKRQGF